MPRRPRSRLAPEDLARLRLPSDPQVSPDGRWVVYFETAPSLELDENIATLQLVDVERGTTRQLDQTLRRASGPSWMPDSRAVVYAADAGGAAGLWRIGVRDQKPERIATFDGKVQQPRVSPDGRSVAFLFAPHPAHANGSGPSPAATGTAQRRPPGPRVRHLTKLDFKHDGSGYRDGAWKHLWVLDLSSRRSRPLTSGEFDDRHHTWSPDSKSIAFVSNRIPRADVHIGNSDVFVVAARGGPLRQLTHERGPKSSPTWSPDGGTIAFVGHTHWPDTVENLHVWVVPVRRGAPRDLMPDADLMCDARLLSDVRGHVEGGPAAPVFSPDGRRIYFVATRDGATNVWEIEARGGTPRQRTFGEHEIAAISQSADGRRWAFVRTTATSPGEVFMAESERGSRTGAPASRAGSKSAKDAAAILPGATVRPLTRSHPAWLARLGVTSPEEIRIPARAGPEIQGWMLRARRGTGAAPAVLMIHGGPYAAYGWTFFLEFQLLASQGYNVFYANLQGSVGYGRDFMRALVGRWGTKDYDDLLRVTEAVEALPFVEASRIAVAGGSYGGYLTAWAIGHTRRYKCAIAMRGVYNLVSMHGSSDIGWDLVTEFEAQRPWESLDRWWRVSPLARADWIRTPLLLLHPEDDQRCPVSQAEELFTALRVLDRDVELVRFLGEGHELSRGGGPHNRVERLRRILDWFDRKL